MSSIQRFFQFKGHLVQHSTTLGHRMVSLLQRIPRFRGSPIRYNTTLGHRMGSLIQRFPQFKGLYVDEVSPYVLSIQRTSSTRLLDPHVI